MTKTAAVINHIQESLHQGQHPVGTLLPSEYELAETCSVSRITVRAALSKMQKTGQIQSEPRRGWRVTTIHDKPTAPIVVLHAENVRRDELLFGITEESAAMKTAIAIEAAPTGHTTKRARELTMATDIAGIIYVAGSAEDTSVFAALEKSSIPTIIIGAQYAHHVHTIGIDYQRACTHLVEQLIQRGHQHIHYVTIDFMDSAHSFSPRAEGYTLGMQRHGLYTHHAILNGDSIPAVFQDPQLFDKTILRSPEGNEATACIFSSYSLMKSCLPMLEQLGKSCPNDISLACFGFHTNEKIRVSINFKIPCTYANRGKTWVKLLFSG